MADQDDPLDFIHEQGYQVRLEQRDLHAEFMLDGQPGRASFYAIGREYWCVDLERDGVIAWPRVAAAETASEAIAGARRWLAR